MSENPTGPKRTRREVLRRRRRERQITVFGLIGIIMVAVTFAAMSVYTGEAEGPLAAPFVTPAGGEFDSDVRLVCPPVDSLPLDTGEVVVRVLNGTTVSGLASTVHTTLEGRGFYTVGSDNWNRAYSGAVRIMFGTEGVQQAYTLAAHFDDAQLVLDNRTNATVDLVVGEVFAEEERELRPLLASELQPDTPLSANAPCLPSYLVPAEPAPRIVPEDPLQPTVTPEPEEDEGPGEGETEMDVAD